MAEGFKIAEAYVQVSPNTDGFKEELKSKLDEATAGLNAKVKVGLDTSELDAKADEAKAKVDELDGKKAEAKAGLDSADLDAKTDEAKAKVDELGGKTAKPKAGLDAADLDAKTDEAKAKVDDLGAKKADPKLGLDKAGFDAKLDEAEARLDAFKAKKADASLGASGGGGGGGGGGLGGLSLPGGMMTGLGVGLAALSPSIGGAATGLGLLGGTGALAFGGISQALSAQHQASQNVGITGAQQAATAFSNSVQMQNAQQQVGQAQQQAAQDSVQSAAQITQAQQQVGQATQQAAQDAITSAQSIESAQSNLASAVRNAAASQVQAEQAVGNAQQGLETSNYGLTEAQYTLSQAWIQARENVINLNNALADSKLSVQSAQLAIQQAEYNQTLTNQNAYSTSIQRAQADLAVAQAKQQLTDAQAQETQTAIAANQANKQGVAGSQQVIQAKQGVVAAQFAQGNAQQAYANAQRQLTLVELNNASQVKQAQLSVTAAQEQAAFTQKRDAQAITAAQRNLAMAQEQAAYTQMRDAQSVANAQQNVTNTLKQQQLQQAATASTANQAANQFAADMAKLTPAGRNFVNQILGMRGAFKQLEAVAQNAVLPGMTVFLTGVQKLLPVISAGIGKMGQAMGSAFASLGKIMQTPAFSQMLSGLIANGMQFVNTVLPAIAKFILELGKIGAQKGAVSGLANLLAGLANGLTGLVKGLEPFTGALSSIFSTLGTALADIGGPLGQVIGALASALAPALKALLPGWKALMDALGSGLSIALKSLAPVLAPVATAISDIVIAIAPLLPMAGKMIAQLAQALTPVLIALVPVIKQIATLFAQGLANSMMQTMGAVLPLLPVVANLIISLMPLINLVLRIAAVMMEFSSKMNGPVISAISGVMVKVLTFATNWKGAFKAIEAASLWLWHNVLDPMWQGIRASAVWLYNNAIRPLWNNFTTAFRGIRDVAMWLWHNVFDPMWQGLKTGVQMFVTGFGRIWNTLKSIFKDPVNFLINTVYDNGIARLWNDVVGAIGLGSIKLPHIAGLAHGGIVPGTDHGKDEVIIAARPEEGVLVPGAVRGIGGPAAIHALNARYGGGGSNDGRHFATGGTVPGPGRGGALGATNPTGPALGPLQGLAGGVIDAVKIAAAVVTGNTAAFTNAAAKLIGTHAAGDLAKIMIGLPKTLVTDLVKQLAGMGGGGGAGGYSSVPAQSGSAAAAQKFAAAHLAQFGWGQNQMPPLISLWNEESGWNANVTNASSGAYGIPQALGKGHPYNLGDYANQVLWGLNYIKGRYGSPAAAYAFENSHSPAWYDKGGWLMPGGMPVNGLGKPEAVLTPEESQAFVTIARHLASQGVGGSPMKGAPSVVQNFVGTQYPNAEQKAAMLRDLALALGGAS